jgi:hypothetical protein
MELYDQAGAVSACTSTGSLFKLFFNGPLTPIRTLSTLIILTAVAMGLCNAAVRRLAVPDLTTTVLTLTLTGLAADSTLAGGHNP